MARKMNYVDLLAKYSPTPRHINSPSYDSALAELSEIYGLQVIS